jgi:high-affinity iron transporter
MWALTDARGNFRIKDVPDGRHTLVVWQESSDRYSVELEVAGATRVQVELQASAEAIAPAVMTTGRPVVPWRQVLRQITDKLESAAQLAEATEFVSADSLVLDAYFKCFEASELETAVLRFRGEERKFVLERMFARLRRQLAGGKFEATAYRTAVNELTQAIEQDIRELESKGVMDRTGLGSGTGRVAGSALKPVTSVSVPQVMSELRESFAKVEQLVQDDNASAAARALGDAYFEVFHRIEPMLASHNFVQMRQLEGRFLDLRGRIQSGQFADSVPSDLRSLYSEIDLAAAAVQRDSTGLASAANRFWNAFLILTREGVEALLIITALLVYLDRSQRPDAKRFIYSGIMVALAATLCTWTLLQWVIAQSGMAQETIEGISALAAAAVLFFVSYWLISKSEARRWQHFLSRQVDKHLSSGSQWAIGLAAFLAVYREGAETILMLQPMLVQPAPSELGGAVAGAVAAAVALTAIFWALRFASFRLAIRPFFKVTGALLFTLAIVFAGKGIAELQEARLLVITPLPSGLHSLVMALPSVLRDALGITPNVQTLAIQATILAGAVLSLASMWVIPSQEPAKVAQPRPDRALVNTSAR